MLDADLRKLLIAQQWYETNREELIEPDRAYIEASITEDKLRTERTARTQRIARWAPVLAAGLLAIGSGLAWWQWRINVAHQMELDRAQVNLAAHQMELDRAQVNLLVKLAAVEQLRGNRDPNKTAADRKADGKPAAAAAPAAPAAPPAAKEPDSPKGLTQLVGKKWDSTAKSFR